MVLLIMELLGHRMPVQFISLSPIIRISIYEMKVVNIKRIFRCALRGNPSLQAPVFQSKTKRSNCIYDSKCTLKERCYKQIGVEKSDEQKFF